MHDVGGNREQAGGGRIGPLVEDPNAVHALHNGDPSIEPGEVLGLMDDSGAGKSRLAKVTAGTFWRPPGK